MASKKTALITTTSAHGEVEELSGGAVLDLPSFNALPLGSRFTKIKNNSGGVLLHLEEKIGEDSSKDVDFKSAEEPHQDFVNAMQAIVELARHILELPKDYARNGVAVGGVTFSYNKNEQKGVVISGHIKLEHTNSPFFFNTPYLPYEPPGENKDVPVVPKFDIKVLNKLEVEAAAYLKGKRAQLDMFNEKD